MASFVTEREERTPLLPSLRESASEEAEILPTSSRSDHGPADSDGDRAVSSSSASKQRLVSLDVFRGLSIALMILVDDAGGAFPSLNHSPWFGVTIADFAVPFFLFAVGVAVGLVLKEVPDKTTATKKVVGRTVKLFLLGVLLQGGYFHGRNNLTYGVDIDHIRWLGILQRISIGYFLAAMSEIWLINNIMVDSSVSFVKRYYVEWIVAILLSSAYVALLYGLYIPNWEFNLPSSSTSNYTSGTQSVHCETRGSLSPPCNAAGLIDRFFIGESHLYQRPVYRRIKACSINSPDYGPLPPNYPAWCLSPFDPEGILGSLMAAVTCFVGLHYAHVIVHFKSNRQRILIWSLSSLPFLISGFAMEALGMPLSKPLYTLSYMCITAGAAGILLAIIYYIVDVKHFRKSTALLQWMGMNALLVYALAACELFPAALQGFYWRSPENNLVNAMQRLLQNILLSKRWGTLAFTLLEILFWCLAAGYLHMKGIYVKI